MDDAEEILMDDILEVTSPEAEALEDLEDDADADHSSSLSKLSKEKPREEQLDYPESLPYSTESLATMDVRSVQLDSADSVRVLIVCIFQTRGNPAPPRRLHQCQGLRRRLRSYVEFQLSTRKIQDIDLG